MHFRIVYDPKLRQELNGNIFSSKIFSDTEENTDANVGIVKPVLFLILLTLGLGYFYHKQIFEFFNGFSQSSVKNGNNGETEEVSKKNKNKPKKL